jgi:hypothetical protein
MSTNLPTPENQDAGRATTLYFNNYGIIPVEFSANEVTAAVSFFESKGFDRDASTSVATVILNQAKTDGLPVYSILDTLKDFNGIQISALVATILNNNRPSTSSLGYKNPSSIQNKQTRNIAA